MGKDLLLQALKHRETDNNPWAPFTGISIDKLNGYKAVEVLSDADKFLECILAVYKLYAPDGMSIIFDLLMEAEILGCDLKWDGVESPAILSRPLEKEKIIPCRCMIPTAESGRIPLVLSAMEKLKKEIGGSTALYGPVIGPFALASHLRGNDINEDISKSPDYFRELVEFCGEVCIKMADMYINAGMDVIAVVDPLVKQISDKHFDDMLTDTFKAIFDFTRSRNALSMTIGGTIPSVGIMLFGGRPQGVSV